MRFALYLLLAGSALSQPWSGVLSSNRAMDWTYSGVNINSSSPASGIPTRNTICHTFYNGSGAPGAGLGSNGDYYFRTGVATNVADYTKSAGSWATTGNYLGVDIAAIMNSCPAGQVVSMAAGTFTLDGPACGASCSSGINLTTSANNVTLRGQGANSTFLVATASGANAGGAMLNIQGDTVFYVGSIAGGGDVNRAVWSAGSGIGQTSITITLPIQAGSNPPAAPSLVYLDQLGDSSCPANTVCHCSGGVDGNTALVCSTEVSSHNMRQGPGNANFPQGEMHRYTAYNGGTGVFTLGNNGLRMPNLATGNSNLAAWPLTVIQGIGIENLSLDMSAYVLTDGQTFNVYAAMDCWGKGLRILGPAGTTHNAYIASIAVSSSITIQDSYLYASAAGVGHYGAAIHSASNILLQNNIMHSGAPIVVNGGSCDGCVFAYNFFPQANPGAASFMSHDIIAHDVTDMMLMEGNIVNGIQFDDDHGTGNMTTMFRNYSSGRLVNTSQNTFPVQQYSWERYMNIVGNVLGAIKGGVAYQTSYTCLAQSTTDDCSAAPQSHTKSQQIYSQGYCGNESSDSCGGSQTDDTFAPTSTMMWGNWDRFNNAARFVAGEVPSGITNYSNAVPGNNNLPQSFYLGSSCPSGGSGCKPSWWPNGKNWPPIGPDVAGGNVGVCQTSTAQYDGLWALAVGQCLGTTPSLINDSTAFGGHVTSNPAMDCYLNTMSGPPDGSGGALTFSASTCYPTGGGGSVTAGLTTVSGHTVTQ